MAGQGKRIIFMGTPVFARTILEHLLNWRKGMVVGVYTQPDRPSGRGRVLVSSPVKELALHHDLPVFQPSDFKSGDELERLAALEPDYLVVAAYGLILPEDVLRTARVMPLNVHASLLPRYRGAAPIQRAIINGERQTGISIMKLTQGMDEGPVLMARSLDIEDNDTSMSLHDKLASLGGELLVQVLDSLEQGLIVPREQDHSRAVYAPKLTKEEGLIHWGRPALEVHNRIRGMFPWPGAYFDWIQPGGRTLRIKVSPGKIGGDKPGGMSPGTITGVKNGYLGIACQDKIYLIPRVQPESGKEMSAQSFYCGFLQKCKE